MWELDECFRLWEAIKPNIHEPSQFPIVIFSNRAREIRWSDVVGLTRVTFKLGPSTTEDKRNLEVKWDDLTFDEFTLEEVLGCFLELEWRRWNWLEAEQKVDDAWFEILTTHCNSDHWSFPLWKKIRVSQCSKEFFYPIEPGKLLSSTYKNSRDAAPMHFQV